MSTTRQDQAEIKPRAWVRAARRRKCGAPGGKGGPTSSPDWQAVRLVRGRQTRLGVGCGVDQERIADRAIRACWPMGRLNWPSAMAIVVDDLGPHNWRGI